MVLRRGMILILMLIFIPDCQSSDILAREKQNSKIYISSTFWNTISFKEFSQFALSWLLNNWVSSDVSSHRSWYRYSAKIWGFKSKKFNGEGEKFLIGTFWIFFIHTFSHFYPNFFLNRNHKFWYFYLLFFPFFL